MKILFLSVCCLFFFATGMAQIQASKRTDALSAKVISFLRNKQPDSIYAMTGKEFREKITAENFNAILTSKVFPTTKFESVDYVSTREDIHKYWIKAEPALQLLLGFDKDNRIKVFTIQEYVPD